MMTKPKTNPDSLYCGDNGRLFCGRLRCAGQSSHFTGRDISGQRVARLTPAELDELASMIDQRPSCEGCRREF